MSDIDQKEKGETEVSRVCKFRGHPARGTGPYAVKGARRTEFFLRNAAALRSRGSFERCSAPRRTTRGGRIINNNPAGSNHFRPTFGSCGVLLCAARAPCSRNSPQHYTCVITLLVGPAARSCAFVIRRTASESPQERSPFLLLLEKK